MDDNQKNFEVLSYSHVKKLDFMFSQPLAIKGKGQFGSFIVCLKNLVPKVLQHLEKVDVAVSDVRLNGGAASYVLQNTSSCVDSEREYGDVDLIFGIDVPETHESLQLVRKAVVELIQQLISEDSGYAFSEELVKEAYIQKMIKVCTDQDCWSLISLGYVHDPVNDINVELKFVSKMKRQFEFSVDSFQIILDSLFSFYAASCASMTEDAYPTIYAESVYGNVSEALDHLHRNVIATKNPEEIRGGGLLKYCYLRSRGYRSLNMKDDAKLQKYMCSRFFIDFKDFPQQKSRLESYLTMHFGPERYGVKAQYLKILHSVIYKSTVCLMCHEHQQILSLVNDMIRYYKHQERHKANVQRMYTSHFDWQRQNHLVMDQVFYGYWYEQQDTSRSHSTSPIPWSAVYASPVSSPRPFYGSRSCSPSLHFYQSGSATSPLTELHTELSSAS